MLEKGMKVKVRSDLEVNKFYGDILFVKHMERFKGKEVVIFKVFPKENNSSNITFYKIEGSVACWTEDMFEPIKENPVPKLESGMFVKNNVGIYGVVAGNKIVYKDGGYDFVSDVIEDDGYIVQIIETIFGFDSVKTGKVIWEYKEKKEEKPKTYLEDFMEKHPNCTKTNDSLPYICAGHCYGFNPCPNNTPCKDCWNAPKGKWNK